VPLYVVGACPCENCEHAVRCRARLEACDVYASYLDGESEAAWRAAPREPQHALYVSLLVTRERPVLPPHRLLSDGLSL